MLHRLTFVFALCVLFACSSASTSTADQLAGHWDMEQILRNGEDVTAEHDPSNNRYIELRKDGTFVSDGDPYGRNTGKWTFDEDAMELYLDSDAGEDDDSYWIVEMGDGKVFLQGARFDFSKEFQMTWKAAG